MEEKYAELEKRVQVLEELLKGFLQSEDNNSSLKWPLFASQVMHNQHKIS